MAPNVRHLSAICFVLVVGRTLSQSSNDLDIADIEKQVQNIPGMEKFNSSELPTEEDLENILREKCKKNGGGEEAFDALKNQQEEIQTCLEAQLNVTQIQLEVEKAKKTGSMDEVFGKYCKKYPAVHKCIETAIEKTRACLDPREQDTLNQTLDLVDELKEFICYKDGDRIAMFIAEGGIECLNSKKDQLQVCVNQTLGSRIPKDVSVANLPALLITDKDCRDFDTIRVCFNEELERCKDSTPANIVDAFFKFLKKHLPCGEGGSVESRQLAEPPNGAGTISSFSAVLIVAVAVSSYF